MTDDSDIATHSNPAWPRATSFILHADLAPFGMPGRWEQLWTTQLSDDRFEVCCIPFFTYGVALGDTVSAGQREGKHWVMGEVISRSGHRTLRLAAESPASARALHEALHESLAHTGLAHEWHGSGYVAIDLPPGTQPQEILTLFAGHIKAGTLAAEVDDWNERP
jgi:hypothetical protein